MPEQMIRLYRGLDEVSPSSNDLKIGKGPFLDPHLPLLIVLNSPHIFHCLLILIGDRDVLIEVKLPVKQLH